MKPDKWGIALLMIGGILLALGILPAVLAGMFFPDANPILFSLAIVLLTPLGALLTAVGLAVWIITLATK